MTSSTKEIEQLNQAIEAHKQGYGWGTGFLMQFAKHSVFPSVKNRAINVLKEDGVRV